LNFTSSGTTSLTSMYSPADASISKLLFPHEVFQPKLRIHFLSSIYI
jgi:hypothetical protein